MGIALPDLERFAAHSLGHFEKVDIRCPKNLTFSIFGFITRSLYVLGVLSIKNDANQVWIILKGTIGKLLLPNSTERFNVGDAAFFENFFHILGLDLGLVELRSNHIVIVNRTVLGRKGGR